MALLIVLIVNCSYYIPEDGDDESQPNVFLAPKPKHAGMPPTLGDVRNAFPLPGRYHFRFKAPLAPGADRDKHAMPVWMDCVDDRQPIPVWRNSVFAKVTRVSVEDDDEDDDDDDEDFARVSSAPAPTPVRQAPPPTPAPRPAEPMLDIFDGPAAAPVSSAPSSGSHLTTPPAPAAGAASLLDMDTPVVRSAPGANDFLGMTAPAQPPATPHQQPYGGQPQAATGFPQQQRATQAFNQYGMQQQQQQQNHQQAFGGLGTPWK